MFDSHAGTAYSFEQMPLATAEERAQRAEVPHIVETINWTKSIEGDAHYKRYFAHDYCGNNPYGDPHSFLADYTSGRKSGILEDAGILQIVIIAFHSPK